MSIWQVAGSSLKLSKMPCTSGSSGPTTIMSISFSRAKALSAGKSVAFRFTFSPASLVPALPGAIYSFSTFGLWAIFHARACSRPPEPNNNTFMGSFTIYNVQFTICLCCGASGKLYRLLYLMIYSLFYSLLSSTIYSLFARPHCIANCTLYMVHCTLKIFFKISCYLLVQMHTVASQDVVLVRGIDKQIGIGTGIHARLHE